VYNYSGTIRLKSLTVQQYW